MKTRRLTLRMRMCIPAALVCVLVSGCAEYGGDVVRLANKDADPGIIEESLKMSTQELHRIPEEQSITSEATEEPVSDEDPLAEAVTAREVAAVQEEDAARAAAVAVEGAADESADGDISVVDYLERIGSEYRIGPGDTLDFRSFDDESLNTEVTVRYDGHISLPLIQDVSVAQATRQEATDLVRAAYQEYFLEPQISLSIQDVSSKYYYVIGDVSTPAEYPYKRPLTLLEAIYNAGGQRINTQGGDSFVGAQGQLVKAVVFRQINGERTVLTYDLSDLNRPGPHQADTPVFPGDIIYVPEGVNLVYLLGEVQSPSVREITQGMTLLQLLATAGGFNTTTARLREVVLMREIDANTSEVLLINVRKMLRTGADFRLKAGDIIYLPQRRLVRLQTFIEQFTGTITPVLDLYNLAYDTWYTDDRLRQVYGGSGVGGNTLASDLTALQTLLNDFQGFVTPTPN